MEKEEIKQRRANAFSATVAIDPNDRIVEMLSRRDGMYVITLDKIIRINLPDDVDAQLEYADAPITQTGILNKGSRNALVARTILQANDFSKWIPDKEKQQRVQDIAWEVMFSLLAFDRILNWLKSSIDERQNEIAKNLEKHVTGPSPHALPIVEDLETEFRSAIFIAKHALNSISELFPALFDVDVGRGRYDQILLWAEKRFGKDEPLCLMLRADQNWIYLWTELRNAFEHPRPDYYVRVNNFLLLPSRQPQLPTWQLKHAKLDNFRPQNMVTALEFYRNNILTFFENLLLELTDKAVELPVTVGVIDRDETARNPECPKRYEFAFLPPIDGAIPER
jgi:hypothetical protein